VTGIAGGSLTLSFDDVLRYPTPNSNRYNTYSTYTDGDGLRSAGTINTAISIDVRVSVVGDIRMHVGNQSVGSVKLTINLRNGTTIIYSQTQEEQTFSYIDAVGLGRTINPPFALLWQGTISANTTFNVDVIAVTRDGSTNLVYFNEDDGTDSYIRFDYTSTIVALKR
jgi:hypothetical protein